jgi:hypothetical protein
MKSSFAPTTNGFSGSFFNSFTNGAFLLYLLMTGRWLMLCSCSLPTAESNDITRISSFSFLRQTSAHSMFFIQPPILDTSSEKTFDSFTAHLSLKVLSSSLSRSQHALCGALAAEKEYLHRFEVE